MRGVKQCVEGGGQCSAHRMFLAVSFEPVTLFVRMTMRGDWGKGVLRLLRISICSCNVSTLFAPIVHRCWVIENLRKITVLEKEFFFYFTIFIYVRVTRVCAHAELHAAWKRYNSYEIEFALFRTAIDKTLKKKKGSEQLSISSREKYMWYNIWVWWWKLGPGVTRKKSKLQNKSASAILLLKIVAYAIWSFYLNSDETFFSFL